MSPPFGNTGLDRAALSDGYFEARVFRHLPQSRSLERLLKPGNRGSLSVPQHSGME